MVNILWKNIVIKTLKYFRSWTSSKGFHKSEIKVGKFCCTYYLIFCWRVVLKYHIDFREALYQVSFKFSSTTTQLCILHLDYGIRKMKMFYYKIVRSIGKIWSQSKYPIVRTIIPSCYVMPDTLLTIDLRLFRKHFIAVVNQLELNYLNAALI